MMVVMGSFVRSLILSRIGWPHPGFFVSTTTTPFVPTKTAVLPPPPFSMYRLALSFSTSTTRGAGGCPPRAGGCWYAATASDRAPTASSTTRTKNLLIGYLLTKKPAGRRKNSFERQIIGRDATRAARNFPVLFFRCLRPYTQKTSKRRGA